MVVLWLSSLLSAIWRFNSTILAKVGFVMSWPTKIDSGNAANYRSIGVQEGMMKSLLLGLISLAMFGCGAAS